MICQDKNPTPVYGACGVNIGNYTVGQTAWKDLNAFCARGNLNAIPTFPAPGAQVSWNCAGSFGGTSSSCQATHYFCGDGVKNLPEQCDDGVQNGKPGSSCSANCQVVEAPACGVNTGNYAHNATNWRNMNQVGFCAKGTPSSQPAFWAVSAVAPTCNKCAAKGFPYCFDVSFDLNSEACKTNAVGSLGAPKPITWQCRNANGANVQCSATKAESIIGKCNTAIDNTNVTSLQSSNSLCEAGQIVQFAANTAKYTDRWTWKCQGSSGTPAAQCRAHHPNPINGQCSTTAVNQCES